jgi:hypothetical protein
MVVTMAVAVVVRMVRLGYTALEQVALLSSTIQ